MPDEILYPRRSKTETVLLKNMDRAIRDYDMLEENDKIVVGISGGIDSLALLNLLHIYPEASFGFFINLFPVYIDLGFGNNSVEELASYICKLGLDLKIIKTDISTKIYDKDTRQNPCYKCARLRKKVIFEYAVSIGCFKVALGHNRDDFLDTFLMNMIYCGELATMKPKQDFFKGYMTIIRPMLYLDKKLIMKYSSEKEYPFFTNNCPESVISKRIKIKNAARELFEISPSAKRNMLKALQRPNIEYLLNTGLKRK